MNQVQRKYLIDRIQDKVKAKIEELKSQMEIYPSASNYIFKAIMTDALKTQPEDKILEALKTKALNAKEGANWLSEERMGFNKERSVTLLLEQLLVLPDDFYTERERVVNVNKSIQNEIDELKIQLGTIEMRVQLASDKTLQKLINEVDDMGDLSLVDTKLKLIS